MLSFIVKLNILVFPSSKEVGVAGHKIAIGVPPLVVLPRILLVLNFLLSMGIHYEQVVYNYVCSCPTPPNTALAV